MTQFLAQVRLDMRAEKYGGDVFSPISRELEELLPITKDNMSKIDALINKSFENKEYDLEDQEDLIMMIEYQVQLFLDDPDHNDRDEILLHLKYRKAILDRIKKSKERWGEQELSNMRQIFRHTTMGFNEVTKEKYDLKITHRDRS